MSDYTIDDIVDFSVNERPLELGQAVNDILLDKVTNAINARREAMTPGLFADDAEDNVDDFDLDDIELEDDTDDFDLGDFDLEDGDEDDSEVVEDDE